MTSRAPGAFARDFQEPETSTTWRVRVMRLTPAREPSLWGGRVSPLVLQFENGVERRRLEPAPPDCRECDDAALWRYCEAAQPLGTRRALTGEIALTSGEGIRLAACVCPLLSAHGSHAHVRRPGRRRG